MTIISLKNLWGKCKGPNFCVDQSFSAHCIRLLTELVWFLAIGILIANRFTRWRGIFKKLSLNRGQLEFSKNLPASLFKKYLSYEPNSSGSILLDSPFKKVRGKETCD
jgi:hypothetical protein